MTALAYPLRATRHVGIARTRRTLQLALGSLWLLDAALQCQPAMFGRVFATQVIAPAARGNPWPVARPELWAAHVMAANPALWNALFATAQFALALGIFWPRTARLALAGSVAWSLGVWWFGEGLGGVLTGASPVAGAPGPVLLYALLALVLWPCADEGASVASAGLLRHGATAAWIALWAGEVYLALLPAGRSGATLRDTISETASTEPAWLATIDRWAAGIAASHGAAIAPALGLALALVTVAVVVPARLTRSLLALAIVLAALIWMVGQSFGGILTGRATDPSSGPLLILLSLAYWPLARSTATAPRSSEAAAP